jgi:hypothetical protein
MKDLAIGLTLAGFSFSVFVLLPFGLAWSIGQLSGASG